jgi:hypothetical protein
VILIAFRSNAERNRRLNPVRRNQKCCIVLKSTSFVHHLEGVGRNFEHLFEIEESKRC